MAQTKKNQSKQRTLTREQQAARVRAAEVREHQARLKAEARERTKKIFTVIVCVILVLALGIPTVALTMFSI